MVESVQVAAFEGGSLRVVSAGERTGEAVLGLPLTRLIVKMVRVPADQRDDPSSFAAPILSEMSPFPDDDLTVSCEVVRESDSGMVVIAAALPESATDDIANALDAEKLSVTRVDALVLGELRGVWPKLIDGRTGIRRLFAEKGPDCISLIVLDDDQPLAIRAVSNAADLRREVMLSLLEAEDFGGGKDLDEIVTIGDFDASAFGGIAPIRAISPDGDAADAAVAGVAERSLDATSLNALPSSWKIMLDEMRFKAKLVRYLSAAIGIWVLIMVVLFGVPIGYGYLTDHQKSLMKSHHREFSEVSQMKAKVELVAKYSDHSRGALEMLKFISDRLPIPEGASPSCIEITSWSFDREKGVRISGEADTSQLIYDFKDAITDDSEVFTSVTIDGPSVSKNRYKFSLDCSFESVEDEE